MESAMEQCETKPLETLSSTLEIFDTFKSQEDDKESDEESFHLPLLGCDDEAENGMELNDEDEDAILNKFESHEEEMDVDESSDKNTDSIVSKNNVEEVKLKEVDEEEAKPEDVDNVIKDDEVLENNQLENNQKVEESTTENTSDDTGVNDEHQTTENTETVCEEVSKVNEPHIDDSHLDSNETSEVNTDVPESTVEDTLVNENEESCLEDTDPLNDNHLDNNDESDSKGDSDQIIDIDAATNNDDTEDHVDNIIERVSPECISKENDVLDQDTISGVNDTDDVKNVDDQEINTDNDLEINDVVENGDSKSDNDDENTYSAANIDNIDSESNNGQVNDECTDKDNSVSDQELINEAKDEEDIKDQEETTKNDDVQEDTIENHDDQEENIKPHDDEEENMKSDDEPCVLKSPIHHDDEEVLKIDDEPCVLKSPTSHDDEKVTKIDDDKLCVLKSPTHNDDEEVMTIDDEPCVLESPKPQDDEEVMTVDDDPCVLNSPKLQDDEEVMKIDDEPCVIKSPKPQDDEEVMNIDDEPCILEDEAESNKDSKLNGPIEISQTDSMDVKKSMEENEMSENADESTSTHSPTTEIAEDNKIDETIDNTVTSGDTDADKKYDDTTDTDTQIQDDQTSEVADSKEEQLVSEKTDNTSEVNEETTDSKLDEAESSKSVESEDLLNISVIRDTEEDNACAIAEIAEADRSENDDQDDGGDNEMEEMDVDQDDNLASSDKDENIEFDEGNTNSCDQDMSNADMISINTSDSENKENDATENEQSETESHLLSADDLSEMNSNQESILDTDSKTESNLDDTLKADANESTEKIPTTVDEVIDSISSGKRPLPDDDSEAVSNKKLKRSDGERVAKKSKEAKKPGEEKKRKVKTLSDFEKFMREKNLGEETLTRSDIEQFCLQKMCEVIVHKSDAGELHQIILKQAQIIDNLRKEVQQISKQAKDLDIVHKKLLSDIRLYGTSKSLVPLKITRSVGLQVKLNISDDSANRRKTFTTPAAVSKPPAANTSSPAAVANRPRILQKPSSVQGAQTTTATTTVPQRKTPPTPILSQALQSRATPAASTPATPSPVKRPPPLLRVKPSETQKPSAPGVIDLTAEDENTAKPRPVNNVQQQKTINNKIGTQVKIVSKKVNIVQTNSPATQLAKIKQPPKINPNQQKPAAGGTPQQKVSLPARAVTAQTVRLSSAQMKNGITLPAGVVASPGTQFMYVLPQGSVGNNTTTNGPKAVLLNFQSTNGVLTSAINGSAVSVIPSKTTNNAQLRTVLPRKHPAPLPHTPPPVSNASIKPLLPKPHLTIKKTDTGLMLQWKMPYNLDSYEAIASYQLYAYQETSAAPSTDMWRKVGDIKALALPMACTLTQFVDKNKYYFAVRPVDVLKRIGLFSDPEEIIL